MRSQRLLSLIYRVPSVEIRRAKSESSYTRRGLRVSTKKEGFHRRSKGVGFEKSKFSGLGGILETSFESTTLQEVEILHTLVYFHPKGCFGYISTLRSCLALFYALRGCLAWVKTTLIVVLQPVCG